MGKITLDPRAFYAILVVVVVVAAFLVIRGASANQSAPLPNPNMFKVGTAKTVAHNPNP
jgi:hypothetical protein